MTTQIIERQNTAATQTVNPFSGAAATASAIPQADNPLAASDAARAVAEVQAALLVARMNPRDPVRAMDRILNACTRPTLAESATYAFSRGGAEVTGPTIRLAEAVAQGWGNIQYGIRELSQKNGVSTVAAYAWDVETNTRREVQFQVALRRDTKRGSYALKDARDIYELVANQGARRLRSCILSVIPGDVIDAALQQCAVTLKANVDLSPEAIAKLTEAFAAFGVTKGQIEKRIQRRIDTIQPAQVISLRKIYVSLRDGMTTKDEWFEAESAPAEAQKRGVSGLKAKLKQTEPEKPTEIPAPAPAPEPVIEDVPDEIAMARSSLDEIAMARCMAAELHTSEDASGE